MPLGAPSRPVPIALLLVVATAHLLPAQQTQPTEPSAEFRLPDILRLSVQRGGVVLRTRVPDRGDEESGGTPVAVHGVDGRPTLLVVGGAEAENGGELGDPVIPRAFSFKLVQPTGADRTRSTIEVSWQNKTLDVGRSVQGLGKHRFVRLIRLVAAPGGGENSVQLVVNEVGRTGEAPVSVNVGAKDFRSLHWKYPNEVETFVRPILRDLGQESLFAPDPNVTWQVFSDLRTVDENVQAQVMHILPDLDSDDPKTRDAALARLRKLGKPGALVLMRLDRESLTPEQNMRVDRALADHVTVSAARARELRKDLTFLLDCLNSDDAVDRRAALDALKEATWERVDFDPDADATRRAEAVAALRYRLTPPLSTTAPATDY